VVNEFEYEFIAKSSEPMIVPPDKVALAALSEANEPKMSEAESSVKVVVYT
jgi:hypothetical protein